MDHESGTLVTDKVVLIDRLAVGSMGEVWLAEHATLRTEVAVKFISEKVRKMQPEAVERFRREAAASAQIRSPHVVRTFDHGETEDGTPYTVMELLEGEPLDARLKSKGQLPIAEVDAILAQCAKGLDAAHALGIIHRDIKPANIFLVQTQGDTFVKVLDFGTAKNVFMEEARLTAPGMLLGSPGYMSRDEILDPEHTSKHMDLWALAVVIYKCLTGHLPFQGDGVGEIVAAIGVGEFEPPHPYRPDLPEAVQTWFERCFSKTILDRYQSGAEMSEAFTPMFEELMPTTTVPPGRPSSAAPPPGPHVPSLLPSAPPPSLAPPSIAPSASQTRSLLGMVAAALAGGAIALAVASPKAPAPAASAQPTAAVSAAPSAAVPAATGPATSAATTPRATKTATAKPAAAPPPVAPAGPVAAEAVRTAASAARVAIPAGKVWLGCVPSEDPNCQPDEQPGHAVTLPAFRMDKTEVTVGAYRKCVEARACQATELGKAEPVGGGALTPSMRCNFTAPGRDAYPLNCVNHAEAANYCRWIGGALPSEAEWARAARGNDKRRFTWGGVIASCLFAVVNSGPQSCRPDGAAIAGTRQAGASPFGVLGMAGNVREWTGDWYQADRYVKTPGAAGPASGDKRVVRGGGWGDVMSRLIRVSARHPTVPTTRSMHLGFRCVSR